MQLRLLYTKNPAITESFISQCEQELADLIGPIASFLVQKTRKFYPQVSQRELVKALAAEIPNTQKADEFQQRLASYIEQTTFSASSEDS